jgi:hypothetical protein
MDALQGYEGPLSWLFVHLLLVAVPAVVLFLVGRRGRLRLWQIAALVLLTALLLLPAAACVHLNSTPMGLHAPGWATMLAALSLGFGLGVVLFRWGRRDQPREPRPFAATAEA